LPGLDVQVETNVPLTQIERESDMIEVHYRASNSQSISCVLKTRRV
jgi:hypothetical protein